MDEASTTTQKLLLMTHSRLLWFDTESRTETLLHEERDARFRGAFVGVGGRSLILLATPDLGSESVFVELSLPGGSVLRRERAVDTWDGHEAVRYGDRVYVVSTGSGSVNVYDARTLVLQRRHALWTRRDHINTIALTPSTMLVLLHRMRRVPSEVHVVERARDATYGRIPDVGNSSHGLAMWRSMLLTLDSDGGRLLARGVGADATPADDAPARVVWRANAPCFLKGLCVLGDVAYLGLSPPQRRMLRRRVNSTLVAVDLNSGQELYRRELPTNGLLNLIAHPHHLVAPAAPTPIPLAAKRAAKRTAPPAESDLAPPSQHRVVSLGPIDVADLRSATLALWPDLWTAHGFGHLFPGLGVGYEKLFRGLMNAKLVFSANPDSLLRAAREKRRAKSTTQPPPRDADDDVALPWPRTPRTRVVFPAWSLLRPALLPIFDEVFGRRLGLGAAYLRRILRVQMNRMPEGADIAPHVDHGFYATGAHRYHIPLIVPRCVRFAHARTPSAPTDFSEASWEEIPFKEGEVFEVNNALKHRVEQSGPYERVTVIVDLLEEPVDTTVEVAPTCRDWFDAECYAHANVTDEAFRGSRSRSR